MRRMSDSSLAIIIGSCENLTSLDLSGCDQITEDGFRLFMARSSWKLRYLNLSWCRGLTDEVLAHILRTSPDLISLDVSVCANITDSSLQYCKYCTNLRKLAASRCTLPRIISDNL